MKRIFILLALFLALTAGTAFAETLFYKSFEELGCTEPTPPGCGGCNSVGVVLDGGKFGEYSVYLPLNDDYISYRKTDWASFWSGRTTSNVGTISFWLKPDEDFVERTIVVLGYDTGCDGVISSPRNRIWIRNQPTGADRLQIEMGTSGGGSLINEEWIHNLSKFNWYHIELNWDWNIGETRFFVNGIERMFSSATGNRSETNYPTRLVVMGRAGSGSFECWIDDIFVMDCVLHTANFTPPTTPGPYGCPGDAGSHFGRPFGLNFGRGFGH